MSYSDKVQDDNATVLSAVGETESLTVEIARSLGMDCSKTNAILRRLENAGHVICRYDSVTGRNWWSKVSGQLPAADHTDTINRRPVRKRKPQSYKAEGEHDNQLKVFTWLSYERRCVRRNICAAHNMSELEKILGVTQIKLNEKIVALRITQDKREIEIAESQPEMIFQRMNDDIRAEFKRKE